MFPPKSGIIESTTVTFAPSSTNFIARLLPIKPSPPVTNTLLSLYDSFKSVFT